MAPGLLVGGSRSAALGPAALGLKDVLATVERAAAAGWSSDAWDGLSVIESWVFSAERFGDTARENAHDFVRHGAGWLVQSNWRGGIETLRLGVAKATDLNCEVTWAMSIARYMEALYAHRPNVAIQKVSTAPGTLVTTTTRGTLSARQSASTLTSNCNTSSGLSSFSTSVTTRPPVADNTTSRIQSDGQNGRQNSSPA